MHFLQIKSYSFYFYFSNISVCDSLPKGFYFHAVIMHKIKTDLLYVSLYFILILPLLTLHCYDVTLWQAWCFLELLWTWFPNLLPCLSWKFGTHFFNLAVLLWNLQRIWARSWETVFIQQEAPSKAYFCYDYDKSFSLCRSYCLNYFVAILLTHINVCLLMFPFETLFELLWQLVPGVACFYLCIVIFNSFSSFCTDSNLIVFVICLNLFVED